MRRPDRAPAGDTSGVVIMAVTLYRDWHTLTREPRQDGRLCRSRAVWFDAAIPGCRRSGRTLLHRWTVRQRRQCSRPADNCRRLPRQNSVGALTSECERRADAGGIIPYATAPAARYWGQASSGCGASDCQSTRRLTRAAHEDSSGRLRLSALCRRFRARHCCAARTDPK